MAAGSPDRVLWSALAVLPGFLAMLAYVRGSALTTLDRVEAAVSKAMAGEAASTEKGDLTQHPVALGFASYLPAVLAGIGADIWTTGGQGRVTHLVVVAVVWLLLSSLILRAVFAVSGNGDDAIARAVRRGMDGSV